MSDNPTTYISYNIKLFMSKIHRVSTYVTVFTKSVKYCVLIDIENEYEK